MWSSRLRILNLPPGNGIVAPQAQSPIFNGVAFPDGSQIGIQENHAWINKSTIKRTLNGRAYRVGSPFGRKLRITITASGDTFRFSPSFAGLEFGQPVILCSTVYKTEVIAANQSSVWTHWGVVDGTNPLVTTVGTSGADEVDVPYSMFHVDGYNDMNGTFQTSLDPLFVQVRRSIVELAAANPTDVIVKYLPQIPCLISQLPTDGANEIRGTQKYDLVLEEI